MILPADSTAQYLVIGGDSLVKDMANRYMTGKMASVELYAGALSATEILEHYNACK